MAASLLRPSTEICHHVYKSALKCVVSENLTCRTYAKKATAKAAKALAGAAGERKRLDVETDPEKLVKFVCGANIYKEGTAPDIKPDAEYPEWLWNLRTERGSVPLEDCDPNSPAYWRKVKSANRKRTATLTGIKHKFYRF